MNARLNWGTSSLLLGGLLGLHASACASAQTDPLAPRGQIHIPIGIVNAPDSLKTFVEAEGNFSPGFGTYGVFFWLWDSEAQQLAAPTMPGVKVEHGLGEAGLLIPWSRWTAGGVAIKTELCQVQRQVPLVL
jgi:hypothetical protein